MDDRTQGALLLAVGGIALRLGLTDAALAYVKTGLQPPLVLTGLVLIGLGAGSILKAFRADGDGGEHEHVDGVTDDLATTDHAALHGLATEFETAESPVETVAEATHDHAHGPGVAWLLVLPLLALLLVAPPALGSFAAARQSDRPPLSEQTSFGALPEAEDGAVPLAMSEYIFRALYDEERSLDGVPVRLTGFVTPRDDGQGYNLSRFTMNCCAADATALNVQIVGDLPRSADTWLEVEGSWEPIEGHEPGTPALTAPRLRASSVQEITEPTQPYEY